MSDAEIELLVDEDGVAVLGPPGAVQLFLESEGLASRDLPLGRLSQKLSAGSGAVHAASEAAAHSGRWVKLTKESAASVKKFGLRESSSSGLSTGVIKGSGGQVKGFVEFVRGPGAVLTNPALLAGAAGIMAQVAMQQAMDEITEYLAVIDEKVDDVLRGQKDAVVADLIGVEMVIDEAMTVRHEMGGVSETTWSKVQATSQTIARTQAYALRQLGGLADKFEKETKAPDVADVARAAETQVRDWLAVLARCVQLQDALAVLELDRVLDASADELERHRSALKSARRRRLSVIGEATGRLLDRLDAAAALGNSKVLMHPTAARSIVRSGNEVVTAVGELHQRLGIDRSGETLSSRRWGEAATEAKDRMLVSGADGVEAARRLGTETAGRARSASSKLKLPTRLRGRRGESVDDESTGEGPGNE